MPLAEVCAFATAVIRKKPFGFGFPARTENPALRGQKKQKEWLFCFQERVSKQIY